jgi:carboxyl-terminal processing protease
MVALLDQEGGTVRHLLTQADVNVNQLRTDLGAVLERLPRVEGAAGDLHISNDLGRLRLTMAEFFRISGGSTQLKGVEPDIRFPSGDDIGEYGERSLTNALPWARIDAANYRRFGSTDTARLSRQSAVRVAQDPGFKMLEQRSKAMKEVQDQTRVSLREADRRAESKHRERLVKDEQDRFLRARGINPVDEEADQVDEEALDAQRDAIARIQVEEAARILADSILAESVDRPRAAMRN